jgi:hypothetical protein
VDVTSHSVGHSGEVAKRRSGATPPNRLRWPFEQVNASNSLYSSQSEIAGDERIYQHLSVVAPKCHMLTQMGPLWHTTSLIALKLFYGRRDSKACEEIASNTSSARWYVI